MTEPSDRPVVELCDDLDQAIERHQANGYRLDTVGPADEPTWAELTNPGLAGPEDRLSEEQVPTDRLSEDRLSEIGRARIRLTTVAQHADGQWPGEQPLTIPAAQPEFALAHEAGRPVTQNQNQKQSQPQARASTADQSETGPNAGAQPHAPAEWVIGRAGMRYRDLIPGRLGGAYIASHIHIPTGGPVPDYVHHHDIGYQLIFCHRGWVRVVYQDQGPPFVMKPGDCVLQPPGIRHQVLEASDDLYVVEVTCPAEHRTTVDHDLTLPTATIESDRRYGGQRFVRHTAASMPWSPTIITGIEQQPTAIADATDGLAQVRLLRASEPAPAPAAEPIDRWPLDHDDDFLLLFVVSGTATVHSPGSAPQALVDGSSVSFPPSTLGADLSVEPGTTLLEIRSSVPKTTVPPV